jgi:predicted RNase H-like HicB family nuclease
MQSRSHRKVNREVYVVPDFGYDLHFGDTLSELLNPANDALKQFVRELKAQGIWEDTL